MTCAPGRPPPKSPFWSCVWAAPSPREARRGRDIAGRSEFRCAASQRRRHRAGHVDLRRSSNDRAAVDVQQPQARSLRRSSCGAIFLAISTKRWNCSAKCGTGGLCDRARRAAADARGANVPASTGCQVATCVALGLAALVEFDQRVLDRFGRAHAGRHARRPAEDFFVALGDFGDGTALRVDLRGQIPQRRQRDELVAARPVDDVDDRSRTACVLIAITWRRVRGSASWRGRTRIRRADAGRGP